MSDLTDIAEDYLRKLEPSVHGGNIWKTKSASSCNEILDFSSNINPLGAPPEALNAIRRALWRIPLYPDPDYASLKNALGEYFGTQNGNIIVGNGSTELIYLLCELFVKQGSEVLIPAPTFGEYEVSTRRVGGIPRFFKLGRQFNIEFPKISRLTNAKSRVIFICNP
ncbi:MAG: aminotransferase class I/II-fold pyridoxal phosphate-dependent enzyme, partial [Thaumarchaeota archaeon]|nr:aminotransferase class I/II-fold pyridoxal phosphate-dependent enzyme [Nitrososphaerota archaeon]